MTIFLVSAIITRPFTGKLLDIVGKRKMLLISLFFYLICTVLYYFITPFEGLLALRFFQGIWFSIVTTAAGSIAADIVPATRRGAGLGYFVMSTNLAVVVGPFIALFIIQSFSYDALFILMSVLMIIGALVSLLIPKVETEGIENRKKGFTWNDLFEKKAVPIALLAGLVAFSYASVLSYLSIYAQEKGLLPYASLFFVFFAAVMLITRPFTGRIFDEKGPAYILIPGSLAVLLRSIHSCFCKFTSTIPNCRSIYRTRLWSAYTEYADASSSIDKPSKKRICDRDIFHNIRYWSSYRILYFRDYCSSYGLPECLFTIQFHLVGSACFIYIDESKKVKLIISFKISFKFHVIFWKIRV